ncbi:glycerophosphodiester phosphodiesterase [Streptomyces sp. N2-109]|uniref:Glycerophosphodiester phosphodiesterase n=1 Tax=Streptomyces gossypii TaxID=2883101 RepID=A0ABT2K3K1_9ACTN|nr:glycerophosphodiester phosphodiesterase [Streptomyces gossypii]MCT2594199.1 glycerophosphodiester phosphodiesterase [Streptomyces gossypii]
MAAVVTAVAHRGAPYVARENTLASFRSAIAAGADAVELDVRISRDGVPVIVHDRTLARLWGLDTPVSDLTATQLEEVTSGGVPTLADALATTRQVRTLIDLPDHAAVPAVVHGARECGAEDRVYYCGGPVAMRSVRAADRHAEIALTWNRSAPIRPSLLADVQPRWLNYSFGVLSPQRVRATLADGYRVSAWTPDTRRTMRRLVAMGVESLTTNRIDTLCRLLGRPVPPCGPLRPARR